MRGRIELNKAKQEEAEIELKLHTGKTQSFANPAEEGKLAKDLETKVKKRRKLEADLLPLEAELTRRVKSTNQPGEGMSDAIRVA